MKLRLQRLQLDDDVTIGSLDVDGDWACWTLEDAVREQPGQPVASWKLPGQTAIPLGCYRVDVTWSPRFKRPLPLLLDVPGFSGVRIHPGNSAADTEGCILVGADRYAKSLGRSRLAFDNLMVELNQAQRRQQPIWLEITR